MTYKVCLLFAAAILLLVSNLMESDGSVAQIAEIEEGKFADGSFEAETQAWTEESTSGQQRELSELLEGDSGNGSDVPEDADYADDADSITPEIGDFAAAPKRTASVPDHHKLQPGESVLGFDPTIAKR